MITLINQANYLITAFKKTPDFQSGDELNVDMSSSFRGNPAFQSGEDVIDKLIVSLKEKHKKEGGLTEELYRKRKEYRGY